MLTGPRIPESELLLRVQRRIDNGRLPVVVTPAFLRAGCRNGADVCCRVCDEQIAPDQIMYEVKDPRGRGQLTFHCTCYNSWHRECAQRIASAPGV